MKGIVKIPIDTGAHLIIAALLNKPLFYMRVSDHVENSTVRLIKKPGTNTEASSYQSIASKAFTASDGVN